LFKFEQPEYKYVFIEQKLMKKAKHSHHFSSYGIWKMGANLRTSKNSSGCCPLHPARYKLHCTKEWKRV